MGVEFIPKEARLYTSTMLPPKEIPHAAKPIVRKALIVGLVCGLVIGAIAGFIAGTHMAERTYVIVTGEGQKA